MIKINLNLRPYHIAFLKSGERFVLWITLAVIISLPQSYAQSDLLPQDFFASSWTEALLDAGYLWQVNSIFHPFPASEITVAGKSRDAYSWMIDDLCSYSISNYGGSLNNENTLRLLTLINVEGQLESGQKHRYEGFGEIGSVYGKMVYRDYYYTEVYLRATNQTEALEHFSGRARPQDRLGFNVGESDKTVLGFQYHGISIEFGRAREIWGNQAIDNLVLAGGSPPYDRFMFQFRFKRFTYRSFFGFLEVAGPDFDMQRYISGGALEYRNHTNLVIGISETSLLSGKNRPIDLEFFNPLSIHLDVDQNYRGNTGNSEDNNAIWGLYADWYVRPGLRISTSIAIDEFELDRGSGDDLGKANLKNALAYSERIAWTPILHPIGLTFIGSWVRIDPFTFKHRTIYSRNVTRNELIGHSIGNDAELLSFGIRSVLKPRVQLFLEIVFLKRGEESMLESPFEIVDDYTVGGFPTGNVTRNTYAHVDIKALIWKHFQIQFDGTFDLENEGADSSVERFAFKLRYTYPIRKVWVSD